MTEVLGSDDAGSSSSEEPSSGSAETGEGANSGSASSRVGVAPDDAAADGLASDDSAADSGAAGVASDDSGGAGEAPGESVSGSDEVDGSAIVSGRTRLGTWVWVVLVLSIVAVATTSWSWRQADTDPELARAALRDEAIIEGTTAVETMNSMDYRDVAGGLKAWRSVTTGVLHDQLLQIGDDERQLLADQGKIATGRVVEAALTELTDRTATLIAAVEVTVRDKDSATDGDGSGAGTDSGADSGTDPSNEPAVKRNRYSADLVLVDGHWKIENLGQVPVSIS